MGRTVGARWHSQYDGKNEKCLKPPTRSGDFWHFAMAKSPSSIFYEPIDSTCQNHHAKNQFTIGNSCNWIFGIFHLLNYRLNHGMILSTMFSGRLGSKTVPAKCDFHVANRKRTVSAKHSCVFSQKVCGFSPKKHWHLQDLNTSVCGFWSWGAPISAISDEPLSWPVKAQAKSTCRSFPFFMIKGFASARHQCVCWTDQWIRLENMIRIAGKKPCLPHVYSGWLPHGYLMLC